MPTQIAVTGASGHIGNVVCRKLLEKGFQVRAFFHSDSRSLTGLDLQLAKGDILIKEDLITLMNGCEVVLNCAAIISINGDENGLVFKTNTEGPRYVLEAAIAAGVKKIIHVSSVHAVGDLPHTTTYNESRPYKTEKSFVYDFSKSTGEQIILKGATENGIEVVVV